MNSKYKNKKWCKDYQRSLIGINVLNHLSNKSARKSTSLFNLDDLDNLVRSSGKKAGKEACPSSRKPIPPRLKCSAKRKITTDVETEIPSLKRRILELVEEIPGFEHQVANYEGQLAESKEAILMRDELIKELRRENGEAAANLALAEDELEKKVTQAVDDVRRDASKTILTSRLMMAREAEDAAFNRAEWDIIGWQKTLDELEEGVEDDDDLTLIEVHGAEVAKDDGGRK